MLDGSAAISRMAPGTKNTPSACLYTVWVALGSPHTLGRLAGHTFATATEAYQYTTKRHTDRNPPAGVPVWFGSTAGPRYAGDKHWPDGDVALSVGNGFVYGTDYPTWGRTGKCTIAQREQQTGRVYLGWTEDFLGNDIAFTAAAGGNATPLEDDLDTDQSSKLDFIYNALRNGGPDMPDANRSIGLSLKVLDDQLTQVVAMLPRLQEVRDAILGATAPAMPDAGRSVGGSLKAIDDLVTEIRNAVTQPVKRDGKNISQAADNMNTGTLVRSLATTLTPEAVAAAVAAKLPTVSGGPALTQEQLVAAFKEALSSVSFKASGE